MSGWYRIFVDRPDVRPGWREYLQRQPNGDVVELPGRRYASQFAIDETVKYLLMGYQKEDVDE